MTPLRICFVCLGNICRSPTAGAIMKHLLVEQRVSDRIEIETAGTGNWHLGDPPDERARAEAASRGIDLDDTARQFSPYDFDRFDYVIAMDQSNLADLKRLGGDEFVGELRLLREFDGGTDLDVPDPYYGGPEGFADMYDIIERACEGLITYLLAQDK